mmetsp:Transcript_67730/g.191699  ORF Transcript_67730/g.191699 Transcript_67730/m.191699 type:complete len:89 (-) Transcript_67730:451-717(-)
MADGMEVERDDVAAVASSFSWGTSSSSSALPPGGGNFGRGVFGGSLNTGFLGNATFGAPPPLFNSHGIMSAFGAGPGSFGSFCSHGPS